MTGNKIWRIRGANLPVGERCHVMGILNVTPDSFSDGGNFFDVESAVSHGVQMATEGADLIDVGGESTRPGADPVSVDDEIERVVPVISRLVEEIDVPISIDTMKSEVASAALAAGAHVVNDVSALRADPAMASLVARSGAGLILMHMQGEPRTMQKSPSYVDVVGEVKQALLDAASGAELAGVSSDSIVIDPGIGFGKTLAHNLALLRSVGDLEAERYPVLVGPSRKSFIGAALDVEVDERLEGTAAVVAWCVAQGVNLIRVHDVLEMVRVVWMTEAIIHSSG